MQMVEFKKEVLHVGDVFPSTWVAGYVGGRVRGWPGTCVAGTWLTIKAAPQNLPHQINLHHTSKSMATTPPLIVILPRCHRLIRLVNAL
jgi:hypothetical protein